MNNIETPTEDNIVIVPDDSVEIILIDAKQQLTISVRKYDLVLYEFFEKLFTFGPNNNKTTFSIHVDDANVANDVIMSIIYGVHEREISTVFKKYPRWSYVLNKFHVRRYFMLPLNFNEVCRIQNVPSDFFEKLLSIYQIHKKEFENRNMMLGMIKRNLPLDYPLEKLSKKFLQKLLSIDTYLVVLVIDNGVIEVHDSVSKHRIRLIHTNDKIENTVISSNGKLAYSCGYNVKFRNITNGMSEGIVKLKNRLCCLLFSNDGTWLLVGDQVGIVTIIHTETGEKVLTIGMHENERVKKLAISMDNTLIASVGSNEITIANWERNLVVQSFNVESDDVDSLAFSPDGKCVICAYLNSKIIVYDIDTGKIKNKRGTTPMSQYYHSKNVLLDKISHQNWTTKYPLPTLHSVRLDEILLLLCKNNVVRMINMTTGKYLDFITIRDKMNSVNANRSNKLNNCKRFNKISQILFTGPIHTELDKKIINHINEDVN